MCDFGWKGQERDRLQCCIRTQTFVRTPTTPDLSPLAQNNSLESPNQTSDPQLYNPKYLLSATMISQHVLCITLLASLLATAAVAQPLEVVSLTPKNFEHETQASTGQTTG